MTFADLDALKAERESKKRELVDRLTKLLVQNFDFGELRFAWYCEGDSIRIEAYDRARAEPSGGDDQWQGRHQWTCRRVRRSRPSSGHRRS
jgi:hypothetical protein